MTQKHARLKRIAITAFVCLLAASYASYAYTRPIPALLPKSSFAYSRAAKRVSLSWPSYGEAAIGAVGYGALASHGKSKPLPTASVAKLVTALCVLRQKPLRPGEHGPTITLTAKDVESYDKYTAMDGSVVRVAAGEQLTEYQALEALLLPSANNIAETLARWAFGSVSAYNEYANRFVREIGMNETTITDPSGFLPSTASSPRDLVLLGEAAMLNPVVSKIVATKTAVIPVHGTVHNVNVLLGHEGIIGIKTGNNDQNPGCFLFASKQKVGTGSVTIIGVIMDGPTLGTAMWDALPLIRSTAGNFTETTIVKPGEIVGSYSTPWSGTSNVTASDGLSIIVWNGTPVSASISLRPLDVPVSRGTEAGKITTVANRTFVIPVAPPNPISRPNILWQLAHPF